MVETHSHHLQTKQFNIYNLIHAKTVSFKIKSSTWNKEQILDSFQTYLDSLKCTHERCNNKVEFIGDDSNACNFHKVSDTDCCLKNISNARYSLKSAVHDFDERYLQTQAVLSFYKCYKTGMYECEKEDEITKANIVLHPRMEKLNKLSVDSTKMSFSTVFPLLNKCESLIEKLENILKCGAYFILSSCLLNCVINKSQISQNQIIERHKISSNHILDKEVEICTMFSENELVDNLQDEVKTIIQQNKELKMQRLQFPKAQPNQTLTKEFNELKLELRELVFSQSDMIENKLDSLQSQLSKLKSCNLEFESSEQNIEDISLNYKSEDSAIKMHSNPKPTMKKAKKGSKFDCSLLLIIFFILIIAAILVVMPWLNTRSRYFMYSK